MKTLIKSKLLIGWLALMIMVSSLGAMPAASTHAAAPPEPEAQAAAAPPAFSCCEKDIRVVNQGARLNFIRSNDAIRINFRVNLGLRYFCEKADKDCFVFYNVSRTLNNNWQMLTAEGWVPVPAALIRVERIRRDLPLQSACDGLSHYGRWGYNYVVVIATTNPVRNPGLEFNLRVPLAKGTSYLKRFVINPIP